MDFNPEQPYCVWIQDIGPAREVATWGDYNAARVVVLGRMTRKVPNGKESVFPTWGGIRIKDDLVFEVTRDGEGVIQIRRELAG